MIETQEVKRCAQEGGREGGEGKGLFFTRVTGVKGLGATICVRGTGVEERRSIEQRPTGENYRKGENHRLR